MLIYGIMEKQKKEVLAECVLCIYYGWKQHDCYTNDIQCDICCEDLYGKYVLELPCGHAYDHKCILTNIIDHKRLTCPTCHEPIKKIDKNNK